MSVTDMEHVLVLSDDIERSREFYCRVVGLHVGERPPLVAQADEVRGVLLMTLAPAPTPPRRIGPPHRWFTTGDLK